MHPDPINHFLDLRDYVESYRIALLSPVVSILYWVDTGFL